jgi:circadian clock protein KaiB
MTKKPKRKSADFEQAIGTADNQVYLLKLCISGMTPRSRQALINLKQICEEYLQGQYELEVIDLYQQPELAARHQIIATPTLLKHLPPPLRQMFGNLSDTKATLRRLGIPIKEDAGA